MNRKTLFVLILPLILSACTFIYEDDEGKSGIIIEDDSSSLTTEGNSNTNEEGTSSTTISSEESSSSSSTSQDPYPGFRLKWSDEFDGSSLNLNNWEYMIGDGSDYGIWGWGNNEKEYYTSGSNLSITNGVMTITAKKQDMGGMSYTSTRIRSKTKVYTTYGRIEAKIKTDAIQGLWPAFWMLPEDNEYGGWPYSGEIDIMEARGRTPGVMNGTLHYGGYPNHQYKGGDYYFPSGSTISSYHTYAVEWKPDVINWFVDDNLYFTMYSSNVSSGDNVWYSEATAAEGNARAPFDEDFHILLNLAVGGNYDGGVEPPSSFTSGTMCVDYVRIYEYIG